MTGGPGFRPQEDQEFCLLHILQTGSEAYWASCPVGAGHEADHSPPRNLASVHAPPMHLHDILLNFTFLMSIWTPPLKVRKFNFVLCLSCSYYMPYQSPPSWLDHSNIWRGVQVLIILSTMLSNILGLCSPRNVRPDFASIQNNWQISVVYIWIFIFG
jgi:hypothetical protein